MDKEAFNQLSIAEQIEYINSRIEAGESYGSVCKSIGIAKSTVSTRIKVNGYVNVGGKYVLQEEVVEPAEPQSIGKPLYMPSDKPQEALSFEVLLNRIESIEKELKALKSESEANKRDKDKKELFEPNHFESNTKQITARLHIEVHKKLEKFYSQNKLISRQTLLNSLLNQALDKYVK